MNLKIKLISLSKLFSVLFLAALTIQGSSHAQPLDPMGEVKIEGFDNNPVSSYDQQQNEALDFIKNIEDSQLASSSKGDLLANPKVSFYFTGLYLYCLKKSGACPFALDSVLVSDYFLNQQNKQGCQNMKNLWRMWVENGYEKRIAYLIPLGLSQKFSDFQQNQRPRYLKCDETLKTFKPDDQTLKSIRLTRRFIEQIKDKKINIFAESGALQEKNADSKGEQAAKKIRN